jgi:hypothetical protein
MAIEKNLPEDDEQIDILMPESTAPAEESDIEIILEDDGGVTVEMGEEDHDEVPFDANLAEILDEDELAHLSSDLMDMLDNDKASRGDWEKQYSKGLELLGFKYEERTKPFKGACGTSHPLLTEAIIQFQSQAFKELMPSEGPVKTQVLGKETREKLMKAERVKEFMNYELTCEMEEYTPEFDQLLFYTGYGGSTFKKVYEDPLTRRMVSKLCLPDDVYIPYNGSSIVSKCDHVTHKTAMSENRYNELVYEGFYIDVNPQLATYSSPSDSIKEAIDKTVGVAPNGEQQELFFYEFHVNRNLSGFEDKDEDGEETGIALPYIITIEESSNKVVGVRRNWKEKNGRKVRKEFFIHYVLVEGPGAYGLGFVHLIGGLAKSATSAMRQLIDAGTLSNLPAGFKAKGARILNDDVPLQPGEWRDIDAGGADLASSLLPLPYKEPSQTLYALLGYCVEAGQRLASIADMQVGDGNQQAAVGTTIALLEKGSTIMSAIHKRMHYAQRLEFKLLAEGFGECLPEEYPYDVPGASRKVKRTDFDGSVDVQPVADPNIFSTAQRITLAQTQLQIAQSAPNMHNLYEAYRRVYEALGTKNIDAILTPQNPDLPKDPATENGDVLDGMALKAFAGQQHDAHIMSHLMQGLSPILQGNPAAAVVLQKHILEHVKIGAEEDVEAELYKVHGLDPKHLISDIQREGMIAMAIVNKLQQIKDLQQKLMGNQEDPLVALKKQELQQNAAKADKEIQVDQQRLQLDQADKQKQDEIDMNRIRSNEQIAQFRGNIAMQKEQNKTQFGGPNAAQNRKQ